MRNPLIEVVEENEDKFFALFEQTGGRLSYEEKDGEKGDFLEIKVLNESARLAGIVWYFGMKRAYIEDIRLMVARKENQKIPMVLLAGEGTTSAGKKELKEAKIRLIKDLEILKSLQVKKKRKKSKKKKQEEVTVDDDVAITEIPESPLIKIAQTMVQKREPEFIQVKEIKGAEATTYEVRGYTSNNDVLAVYRTVDNDSIGVKVIRQFASSVEGIENAPIAIIATDRFTPSAKKEAQEIGINLISEREEIATKGDIEQQKLSERLKQGAIEIIEQRGYVIVNKTAPKFMKLVAGSESLGTYIIAENETERPLLVLLPSEEVVRVATVREFNKQMESLEIDDGMLIALKRFTYTAEREAKEFKIVALKKNHPVFNIFSHELVPVHELMTPNGIDEMLVKYHTRLNQLPRIYDDDPGVVAVNAKVGDVIRIYRSDDSENFRLVIPRPESGITESTALIHLEEEKSKKLLKSPIKKKVKAKSK
ncbi:MAG: DNA-directed RNA polymerase subunit RpoH/Rpb5 C-terminal domain-containing protein [Candidatus Kariarchaeaceae archaeon]|jgi:DNA-directed RNA polymerase subunit H (RpoH/RPB5)